MSPIELPPRFEQAADIKLVGRRLQMSFAQNNTRALWQGFMPRRKEILNVRSADLFSVEVYPDTAFFQQFDPQRTFEKWAAVEVTDFSAVPEGLETLLIPAGLYAVFAYRGPASEGERAYRHIFETWLPASGYLLDERPHVARMGECYKGEAADSEEEIWIPVRPNPAFAV